MKNNRFFVRNRVIREDKFRKNQVFLPNKTDDLVREYSKKLNLPISRLIAYAVDKELNSKEPFDYPIEFNLERKRVENEFAHEAQLVFEFIKNTSPMSLDQLILCRRDIGIKDIEKLVGGYIELLEADVIEEKKPNNSTFKFTEDYYVVTIKKEWRK